MKEYIEKEATIKRFTFATLDCLGMEPQIRASDVVKAIESIPSADVVEVGTYCPRCHFATNMKTFKTCPNCGAKMTEV